MARNRNNDEQDGAAIDNSQLEMETEEAPQDSGMSLFSLLSVEVELTCTKL